MTSFDVCLSASSVSWEVEIVEETPLRKTRRAQIQKTVDALVKVPLQEEIEVEIRAEDVVDDAPCAVPPCSRVVRQTQLRSAVEANRQACLGRRDSSGALCSDDSA
jgi:hypothetical protein